jgi:hypothetical protein
LWSPTGTFRRFETVDKPSRRIVGV